jgi:hypothetical protein
MKTLTGNVMTVLSFLKAASAFTEFLKAVSDKKTVSESRLN